MTCEQLNEQLWDYLYGLLDDAEIEPLREHLVGCPHCQEELRIAQVQQKLLARAAHAIREVRPFVVPGEEAPVPAGPTIAPAQPSILPRSTAAPRRARARRWWPAWAAAAAILIAAGFGYFRYQDGLDVRRSAAAEGRKQVNDAHTQFAALQNNLERELAV